MANPSSLKPFKKGNDPRRNLKGRPNGSKSGHTRFKELFLEALQKTPLKNSDKTLEEIMIEQLIYYALKGKYSFYKLFMDYRFGKAGVMKYPDDFEPEQAPIDDDLPKSVFEDPEVNALRGKYISELGKLLLKKGYLKK